MRQVKGKCAMARWFTTFLFITLFATGLAYGQGENITFNIPYGFTAGSKALPAGRYTFSISRQLSRLTVASDQTGSTGVSILSWMVGPNELFQGGYLVFDNATNGHLVLSEVWLTGTDGALVHSIPGGHDRLGISGTSLDMSRTYSGKTAYSLTCARCHGENGKGNPEADKFFGVKIPRLTSAEVQGKSDAQLKLIISQGTSVMPPVEIDESGFRHRLPPQDVDAVVAYLRTLK